MAVSFGTVLVALIAVTAAIVYRQFTEIPCQETEEIRLKGFVSSFDDDSRQASIPIPLCQVFSDDYEQAKRRFRQALEGLTHEIYSIPVVGETYTMDIAVLPGTPDNTGLVVHTSGVHGIEGYAGSAIQLAFLRTLAEETDAGSSSSRPTVILVHAFNPYGMAHYRRVNENNVDLNRNALRPDDWKRAEHHPNQENYDRFNDAFNPTKPPTWFYGYVQFWLESLPLIAIHGLPTLKAALVVGQHHRPTSVFYNGQKVEASIVKLEDWLTGYLQSRPLKFTGVTWIDVHTGLGAFGEDTILPAGRFTADENLAEYARHQLEQWYPDSHHPTTSKVGATVLKGYDGVKFVEDYFASLFDEDQQALLAMQEFGTLHNILVARALVMENAAYHHASDPTQALEWAKRVLRPAFCPSYPQWRRAIVQRGVAVLYQSMKRSLHYSSLSPDEHRSEIPDEATDAEMSHDTT